MSEPTECGRCGKTIEASHAVSQAGRVLCDDCAMDLMSPPKACDPWAVKMASGSFQTKADAIASLQGVEKALYELVARNGGAPFEKLPSLLGISENQVKRSFAALRHMELLRGAKRSDGGVDCVPFDA